MIQQGAKSAATPAMNAAIIDALSNNSIMICFAPLEASLYIMKYQFQTNIYYEMFSLAQGIKILIKFLFLKTSNGAC